MKIFKKICGIIVNVALWSTLAISALLVVFMVVSKVSGKQPTLFGFGLYQIVSGSMEPELKVGEVILGKKVDASAIKIGDNIVFNYNNKVVTHKVIEIRDDFFITHGLANPIGSDETIPSKDVIARQVAKVAGLGIILDFMRSPFGFILVILVPLGGLIIYQTFVLTKRIKEYHDEPKEDTTAIKTEIDQLKNKLNNTDTPPKIDPPPKA